MIHRKGCESMCSQTAWGHLQISPQTRLGCSAMQLLCDRIQLSQRSQCARLQLHCPKPAEQGQYHVGPTGERRGGGRGGARTGHHYPQHQFLHRLQCLQRDRGGKSDSQGCGQTMPGRERTSRNPLSGLFVVLSESVSAVLFWS